MRFSIGLAYAPPEHYLPLAKAADEAGYHAIAVSDHVLNLEELQTPYPYTADGSRRWKAFTPWMDPWVSIGAMAAVTERLHFFTNVYVLPMRNVFHAAKAVGTAAAISGNRIALGIGMGWCEEEFELMEQPFRKRGARGDEQLEVLRKVWTGEMVDHHGAFYEFPNLEMNPPVTAPVPVYVGGTSDAALKRAARNDGWISDMASTEELGDYRKKIDAFRDEYGRSDQPFAMIGSASDAVDVDGYRRVEAVGVTDLLTMPWFFYSGFTDDLQLKIDGTYRFAEDVLAHFEDR
ncbi:MAG: TIGR03619 family F420-dependent LLM class oxidoreductase [Acidimicrobiia bacterium]|nr:TIGR03619 family F420-dependent LLM class oxidoreductase [Acidimicrobiia bacterium]